MPFCNGCVYDFQKYRDELEKLINGGRRPKQLHLAILKYLEVIKASKFVVEHPYVDNDYLEDYASYYASSFQDYERLCHRVHFFRDCKPLTTEFLNKLLQSGSSAHIRLLEQNYLGFMVIRPFTSARIGRTCLVTYGNDDSRNRNYFAVRAYSSHLYGIPLTVETMAFQEQDRTTTACASIAVWSALHIAGKLFQRRIPSPSTVTKNALVYSTSTRKFPSKGLSGEQICIAISKNGLVPYKDTIPSLKILKAIIYAYGMAGLPIICGLNLFDTKNGKPLTNSVSLHAITLNGFSFEGGREDSNFTNDIKLVSSRINYLYGHDDQLCPFAKMEVSPKFVELDGIGRREMLLTNWNCTKGSEKKMALVGSIYIPLHSKIRIQFSDIYQKVLKLETLLGNTLGLRNFEWKIRLQELNTWKNELLKDQTIIFGEPKHELLKRSYPKYIWRIIATRMEIDYFELVYDTTESVNGSGFIVFFCYMEHLQVIGHLLDTVQSR